jgi:hypothetical protein
MKSKIVLAIGATFLVFGMLAVQGCYVSHYPGYGGYGYAPAPGYGYAGPRYYAPAPAYVREGAYDEHHAWHDRNWWVNNRRDWVNNNHKEWLGHKDRDDQHHDHDAH